MKNEVIIYLSALIIVSGCASTLPAFKKAVDSSAGPRDFYAEAASIEIIDILPKAISSEIRLKHKGSLSKSDIVQVKNQICNGTEPRIRPSFKVKVLMSKPPTGMALDKAADQKSLYFANAEDYLKNRFFSSLSNAVRFNPLKPDLPKTNSNFDSLMSYKTGEYYNPRDLGLNTPVATSPNQRDIEKYYSEVRSETGSWKEQYFEDLDKQFFIFWFKQQALIVPKLTRMVKSGWQGQELDPKVVDATLARYSSTLPQVRPGDVDGDSNSDFFKFYPNVTVSKISWNVKGNDKPLYPLQAVLADDLHFLVENFTFVFQREDVEKVFGYEDPLHQQHYGPEFNSGKVDLEKVTRERGFLWDQTLAKSTILKESPQDNQSTLYEVSLDFGIFCKYGIAVNDVGAE